MTSFLTINGYPVPVSINASGEVEYQEVGGEVVRAYAGNLLSSVKAHARVWKVVTVPMPNQMGLGLASTLELGGTLDCDGVFLGGPVTCRARSVRTMAVATAHGPHRVVEFELHEQEPAKSPWAIVFGYQGGNLISRPAINFSRSSPAMYRDRSGVWQEAGPGVPRTTWGTDPVTGLLVPRYLTEPGGENLIPGNRQRFDGWQTYMGATATITQGQTIPGLSPAGAATRIQTGGGSDVRKLSLNIGPRDPGGESFRVFVHNVGANAVQWNILGGGDWVVVEHGQVQEVRIATAEPNAGLNRRIDIRALNTADDLDLVAWAPQFEAAPYSTSPILDPTASSPDPTVRARDTLYLDLPEEVATPGAPLAIYARALVGAKIGSSALWGIGSSAPRLTAEFSSSGEVFRLAHASGEASTFASMGLAVEDGDLLEALALIWTDPQGGLTGELHARVLPAGSSQWGPIHAADLPPLEPAPEWSERRLYIGSRGTAPGVYEYEALKVYAGRLGGSDEEMMAFMAAFGGV